ncbi:MAG: hypothetical protein ACI8QG_002148, partial [Flavobacteriales bacterium]
DYLIVMLEIYFTPTTKKVYMRSAIERSNFQ